MITYTALKANPRKLLALTGFTAEEFELLLSAFAARYERLYRLDRTLAGKARQRYPGGGRKGMLDSAEQKLLFISIVFGSNLALSLHPFPLRAL